MSSDQLLMNQSFFLILSFSVYSFLYPFSSIGDRELLILSFLQNSGSQLLGYLQVYFYIYVWSVYLLLYSLSLIYINNYILFSKAQWSYTYFLCLIVYCSSTNLLLFSRTEGSSKLFLLYYFLYLPFIRCYQFWFILIRLLFRLYLSFLNCSPNSLRQGSLIIVDWVWIQAIPDPNSSIY